MTSQAEAQIEDLMRTARTLDFYELVRLLERVLAFEMSESPDADADDRIVFEHSPELAFPASDVASLTVEAEAGGARAWVSTTFLGLLGAASPLSPEWSEEVLLEDEEGALRALYDAFHHRALGLLYVAWKSHALEGGFDLEGGDAVSQRLRSVAGIDAWAPSADHDPLPGMSALGLADYQRAQPHCIDLRSSERLLRRLFPHLLLRLEPAVARFVAFASPERARLGVQRSRLGDDLVYGEGCSDREGLVRIHVGPVDAATFDALMPGAPLYARMHSVALRIFGAAVDLELEVHVRAEDAPTCALGRASGSRLGIDARYSYSASASDRLRVRVPVLEDGTLARRTFIQG